MVFILGGGLMAGFGIKKLAWVLQHKKKICLLIMLIGVIALVLGILYSSVVTMITGGICLCLGIAGLIYVYRQGKRRTVPIASDEADSVLNPPRSSASASASSTTTGGDTLDV